jgi:hypothetical protein
MGPTAYRPARELERAAERGELDIAVGIAKDLAREHGRPIPLNLALVLLPLIAAKQPEAYDGWALRWLGLFELYAREILPRFSDGDRRPSTPSQ